MADFGGADTDAFRAEARAWLAANVPERPLPSGDTRAGFEAHLDRFPASGAEVLNVSLPARSEFQPGLGRIDDPDVRYTPLAVLLQLLHEV